MRGIGSIGRGLAGALTLAVGMDLARAMRSRSLYDDPFGNPRDLMPEPQPEPRRVPHLVLPGPCHYRPTGSKRSRRRNSAK